MDLKAEQIIKEFDELLPWDKNEVMEYLATSFGYVEGETIDPVESVIDNHWENMVLDHMDIDEIIDYLYWQGDLSFLFEKLYNRLPTEEMVQQFDKTNIIEILHEIKEQFPEEYKNFINEKENQN